MIKLFSMVEIILTRMKPTSGYFPLGGVSLCKEAIGLLFSYDLWMIIFL